MRSSFGTLLETRCRELGIESQVEFRALLQRAGCVVSANTISAWHTGAVSPRPGRLAAVCDVLDLHGADRDRAYRLAGEAPTETADHIAAAS